MPPVATGLAPFRRFRPSWSRLVAWCCRIHLHSKALELGVKLVNVPTIRIRPFCIQRYAHRAPPERLAAGPQEQSLHWIKETRLGISEEASLTRRGPRRELYSISFHMVYHVGVALRLKEVSSLINDEHISWLHTKLPNHPLLGYQGARFRFSVQRCTACSEFGFCWWCGSILAEVYDTSALSFFEEEVYVIIIIIIILVLHLRLSSKLPQRRMRLCSVLELGLHTNWSKTKVHSLSDFIPRPPNQTV